MSPKRERLLEIGTHLGCIVRLWLWALPLRGLRETTSHLAGIWRALCE